MATINLGAIKFNWKGAYNNATAYAVDDVVSSGGSSYVCILASTGNAVSNGTYWQVMAEGGDVATTLTTQGDILYRDGSGLQRLSAGTSGQVLQTGGTGANPSWGTVSSDYVKLASTQINVAGNTVTQFIHDNIFDDTIYNSYKIFINNYQGDAVNANLKMRFRNSGSDVSTAKYDYVHHDAGYITVGSGNPLHGGVQGTVNDSSFHISEGWSDSVDGNLQAFNSELNLSGCQRTDVPKVLNGHHAAVSGGTSYLITLPFAGVFHSAESVDGLKIMCTEYIRTIDFAIYGLKK